MSPGFIAVLITAVIIRGSLNTSLNNFAYNRPLRSPWGVKCFEFRAGSV